MRIRVNRYSFLLIGLMIFSQSVVAQDPPKSAKYKDPITALWLNTYGNIRITDHLFWVAETHFRLQETPNTAFIGQMAQIYNRHAIGYLFSKNFNVNLGGVLRVNYNTSGSGESMRNAVPEWRIWHQYLFAMPFSSAMVYHRLRIEHRWSRGFNEDSEYIFRNRWRYMFRLKVPLNKPKLGPHTFYISPEAELIMQSGKSVVDSPMEDLRLHTSFGYIINPRLTVATGFMYSFGQDLADGGIYKQKLVARFHVYFAPDWRKVKYKLPSIHQDD